MTVSSSAHPELGAVSFAVPSSSNLAGLGEELGALASAEARLRCLVVAARALLEADACVVLLPPGAGEPLAVAAHEGLSSLELESLAARPQRALLGAGAAGDRWLHEAIRCHSDEAGWFCCLWRGRHVASLAFQEPLRLLAFYGGWIAEGLWAQHDMARVAAAHARHRDDFVCVASHELRSPLTALQLQLQLVARRVERLTPRDASMDKVVEGVGKAVAKCGQLVALGDTLLDAARTESGIFDIRVASVDLTDALQQTVESLRERLMHAGCQLQTVLQPAVRVDCDRTRVQQVVTNLLGNAIKYAPGSLVRMTLRAVEDSAVIEISDGGPGIPVERHQQIFERFARTGANKTAEGWGLGLYIVSRIVTAHAGSISVRNAEPTGSIFTVRLPRVVRGDNP